MRFFHLSDLHIGLKLYNRDLLEDQRYILQQIVSLAAKEQPDAVVIAGDLYDRAVPSAEAVEAFDEFVTALTQTLPAAEIMMISGNHDSAPRINTFRSVLQAHRIHMIGLPPQAPAEHIACVTVPDTFGEVRFWLLPFVRPSMVRGVLIEEDRPALSYDETVRALIARENIDFTQRNVIVSHQFYLPAGTDPAGVERMASEVVTVGNIDVVRSDVLESFDYAALGHIHKPMRVGRDTMRYCGTPIACSVSEAGQQKGIVLVEMGEKGDVKTRVLPLRPLRQVRVITGLLQEVLAQESEDYVTVVLTDPEDLDVIDMQDRLRRAFPNLLEIRRTGSRSPVYADASPMGLSEEPGGSTQRKSPLELCEAFLGELDAEELAMLRDVITEIQSAGDDTL